VEILVSWAASIDIFPGGSIIEAKLVGRYSYDRSILVMTVFDEERNATAKQTNRAWNWRDSG
jgi:hypothetical protein